MQALVFISKFSTHQLDIVVGERAVQTANQTAIPTMISKAAATPKTPGFEIYLVAISIIGSLCIYRRKH